MNPFAQSDLERELPPARFPSERIEGMFPTPSDAFQMGGAADMSSYKFQDNPQAVWGAYDRAQAQRAKEEAQLQAYQRNADKMRVLRGAGEGPEDIRTPFTGQNPVQVQKQADALGDILAPSDLFDAATYFNPAKRLGAIGRAIPAAAGVALGSDPAEAGVRDPRLWSAISKTKLRKPLDEMAHRYTDVRTPPVPRFVNPEDLVGGYGLFTPWDLSAFGKTLTHVDDQKLANSVRLHGGVGFQEGNPGMAAASEPSIARRMDNLAKKVTDETGKPVFIMPITQSASGVDASHHVADPLAQLTQTAPITRKSAQEFDALMREVDPRWLSIQNKRFPEHLRNLEGAMSTKAEMARLMALGRWQEKGFPDVAAVRHAVSEPALIEQPRNTTGMTIARYTPGKGLLDTNHPSYSKGVAGEHMGQLASLVPFEDAAPSIAEALARVNAANKAMGKKVDITPAFHLSQRPNPNVPLVQYFDEAWAKNIRKRWGERD